MIRMKRIAAIAAAVGITALFGQTSSFEVLNIGAGSISSAQANAAAAEIGSLEGTLFNPATIASLSSDLALAGSYNPYLSMTIASGMLAARFGALTLGASGYGLIFDPIIGYVAYSGDPGQVLASGDYVFGASGALSLGTAFKLPFMLDIGVTVRYALEVLDTDSLSALMGDIGLILGFRNIFGEDTLSFGVYGKNLGIPLSAPVAITLPSAVVGGLAYRVEPKSFFLGVKLLADVSYQFNDTMKFNIGGAVELFKIVSLRAGYMIGYDARGLTAGAGARVPIGGMSLMFDYAIVPMGDLGMHHALQLGVTFGAPAADPARDAFEKGEMLLSQKRYTEALQQFAVIPPSSPLYAAARTKIAQIQTAITAREKYEEGERHIAAGNFADAITAWQSVPESDHSARARDGIARAQASMASAAQTAAAAQSAAPQADGAASPAPVEKSADDIYIEAVSFAKEKKYQKAISLWQTIPADSELYERAQKSIARARSLIAAQDE